MRENLEASLYHDKDSFTKDLKLIFSNCKAYNLKNTIYYKCAAELEDFSNRIMSSVKEQYQDESSEEESEASESRQRELAGKRAAKA